MNMCMECEILNIVLQTTAHITVHTYVYYLNIETTCMTITYMLTSLINNHKMQNK